ncbi:MAG: TonB-dependent receptor family protein [Syntrophothermus sp.]
MYKIVLFFFLVLTISALPQASEDSNKAPKDTLTYETDAFMITGTRTNKKIIDIPFSVYRMSPVEYKFDKSTSINDVMGGIPGLFMQSRYGNHDVRISIRGFGSRSNSGIRGVRILLDGIPESEPDGQTRIEAIDFNAVGNIELVKGNSSSLYTNAPGGVINFINNVYFNNSFAELHSEAGEFGLRKSGIKLGINSGNMRMLTTYSYHNYKGFRAHSNDYWHILNTTLETIPNDFSKIEVLGYFVNGTIRLPGSLTKAEFEADPFQPASRENNFDFRRVTKKGRLGVRYDAFLGAEKKNEIEVMGYGTIKYFERAQKDFRIMNRYGVGGEARFVNRDDILGRANEFSFGTDLFYQAGPVESYNNIGGSRGDILASLTDETISNVGFYFQDMFDLWSNRLSFLLTGRYDKVLFDVKNQILQSQNDIRNFEAFTPKAALNFKLTPSVALFGSYGYSFDSPAANEMDNFVPDGKLLNASLLAQKSRNTELGIKGNIFNDESKWFSNIFFELVGFNSVVTDEIVPFEFEGSIFYKNSAKTNRNGIEFGITTNIYKTLRLQTAYTLSDFVYKNYIAESVSFDSLQNIVIEDKDFSNKIVPSVPKNNFVTSLSYDVETPIGVLFLKGTYQYVSSMYVDDANSEQTDAYSLLNTTLGLNFKLYTLDLILSGGVNNLLDERYVGFININSTNGRFYEAGEPRNFFLSLRIGSIL